MVVKLTTLMPFINLDHLEQPVDCISDVSLGGSKHGHIHTNSAQRSYSWSAGLNPETFCNVATGFTVPAKYCTD